MELFINKMNLVIRPMSCLIVCISSLLLLTNAVAQDSNSLSGKIANNSTLEIIPGELLVKFKQPMTRSSARSKARRFNARSKSRFNALGVEHWRIDATQNLENVIASLKADSNVVFAEPNYRRYPRFVQSRISDYPQNTDRLNDLNLPKLWEIEHTAYRKLNRVKVAIIDDAFQIDHEDLSANIILPFDAIDGGDDPSPEVCVFPGTSTPQYSPTHSLYKESHGTLVLGVLGAVSNNGKGIDGAADNALMIPIRMGCNYSVAYEMEAFNHALTSGANIINMSWGGPQFSEAEREAILALADKDILIVTAAGNFHADNDRVLDFPSGLDLPNILSVAAISREFNLTKWSQYGQTSVDIAAPGEFVTTTSRDGRYARSQGGTSFSAPFVAGVAASLLARSPEQTTLLDVKAAILASAKPFNDGLTARLATDGYVDAFAAYQILMNPAPAPVISKISIDDSGITGNGNGVIDAGENVKISVSVDNIGLKADSLSAILSSRTLGEVRTAFTDVVPGFDQTRNIYGNVALVFDGVDFTEFYDAQNIEFELNLTSHFGTENKNISRFFTIDSGSLSLGTAISNKIRANDNEQDEFHYYHVNVEDTKKPLNIKLTMAEQDSDIDLLVKYKSPPNFSYGDYENSPKSDGYELDTLPGIESGLDESVTINNPELGTYFIVVIADSDITKSNMAYTLLASGGEKPSVKSVQGCSLSGSQNIDPLFYVLLLVSFWRIKQRAMIAVRHV